jgi:hypothetical protein
MHRSLAVVAVLLAALGAAAPAGAASSHPDVSTNCMDTAHRPRAMQTCGVDYVDSFRRLHGWHWGAESARGRGRWTPGCQLAVGSGCPRERKAVVRLSRPRSCGGGLRVFTRLRVHGGGLHAVLELSCPIAMAA